MPFKHAVEDESNNQNFNRQKSQISQAVQKKMVHVMKNRVMQQMKRNGKNQQSYRSYYFFSIFFPSL